MPVTAVRDEGALRMWVCRLPAHIGPLGSYEFAADFRKNRCILRADSTKIYASPGTMTLSAARSGVTVCVNSASVSGSVMLSKSSKSQKQS